jgi:hypothetical protein
MTGPLPLSWDLPVIQAVYMDGNSFSNNIPPSIGNLTTLRYFSAGRNRLWGQIPDSFVKLSNLFVFDLASNALSGKLPEFSLSAMLVFDIGFNFFSMQLPESILRGSINLVIRNFNVGDNFFEGRSPTLSDFKSVESLILHDNLFTGDFFGFNFEPSSSLVYVDTAKNYFDGIIPNNLSLCRNLQVCCLFRFPHAIIFAVIRFLIFMRISLKELFQGT